MVETRHGVHLVSTEKKTSRRDLALHRLDFSRHKTELIGTENFVLSHIASFDTRHLCWKILQTRNSPSPLTTKQDRLFLVASHPHAYYWAPDSRKINSPLSILADNKLDIASMIELRRLLLESFLVRSPDRALSLSISLSVQSLRRFMNRVKYLRNREDLASIRSPLSDSSGCSGNPRWVDIV